MLDPAIRPGLDQWGVFGQEIWLASRRRHDGKTVEQIILETYPGEGGRGGSSSWKLASALP
jgi:hypothetical protein